MHRVDEPNDAVEGDQEERGNGKTGRRATLKQFEELRKKRQGGNAAVDAGEVVDEMMVVGVGEKPAEESKHGIVGLSEVSVYTLFTEA